jgi:hypothetical protein
MQTSKCFEASSVIFIVVSSEEHLPTNENGKVCNCMNCKQVCDFERRKFVNSGFVANFAFCNMHEMR